ncbi:LCP family protein [Hominifimenecus sp. rT4P-3]|uniref:LCP family protein n=1 Tax=Hominifimenecus sp. rT4P-3 TaxID=3242979 RepID=UPI003DA6BABB
MGNRDERYRGDRPRRPRTEEPRPRNSRSGNSYGSRDERPRSSRSAGSYNGTSRARRVYPGEEERGRSYMDDSNRRGARERRELARRKKRKKKIILVVVEVILLLLVAVAAFGFFYVKNLWDKVEKPTDFRREEIQTNENIPESVKQAKEKYTTILLFGVDSRSNKNLTSPGANADTDIIACINNETKEVKLVSILRDSFFETTEGKHDKLTDIYSKYGVKEAIQTINRNLDLTIDQYVTVNWKAVADTVNMMDGLDLELSSAEVKALNNYIDEVISVTGLDSVHVDVNDGYESDQVKDADNLMYHLDGVQVLTYARIRSVGHHDLTRAERQRTVIAAMMAKAKTLSLGELEDICETIMPGISTNLSLTDVLGLVLDVGDYTMGENTRIPFDQMYRDQEDKGPAYVYYYHLTDNVAKLHEFLYGTKNYAPTNTVQKISDYIDEYRQSHK